eukprot:9473200-Pyramimonas_sp.AAC.1
MAGDPGAAQRKVRAARRALRSSEGVWKDFSVPATEGGQARVYVGVDKSPKQVRMEVQTKKLAQITKDIHETARVKHDRNKGWGLHRWGAHGVGVSWRFGFG